MGMQYPGDASLFWFEAVANGANVIEFLEIFNSHDEGYAGPQGCFLFADNQGNIAYALGHSYPDRKDKTPYIG